MSNKIKFSIVTVCYNDIENLELTIKSVTDQKNISIQYIIVDGGSSDGTKEMIEKYKNKIDVFISEKDSGIYNAMNKGIGLASGEFINFLNAGDLYSDSFFLHNLSKNCDFKQIDLCYTDFKIGDKLYSPTLNKSYLLRNMLCHQSIFYSRKIFEKLRYNEKYQLCADFENLVRIFESISFYHVRNLHVVYLGGGLSSKLNLQEKLLNERMAIISDSEFSTFYKIQFYIINSIQLFRLKLCTFL